MAESSPELKSLIEDIINKYLNFINVEHLKEFIFDLVEKNYRKGLDEGELQFNQNFLADYNTLSFIQNFAFDNVKGLNEELKDRLRKEMSIGLMNGEGIPQLKLRILDIMDITIQRAELIARTESIRALNMGHYQSAKESGLELKKQWIAAPGERTCETCGFLDQQIVDMNEKFVSQKGEEFLLPVAHINCRCRVSYIQV